MPNEKMVELGEKRSVIRDLFEYGLQRKKEVGEENVYDFSLGNPSIPAPACVNETLVRLIEETEPTVLHGYSSAAGDPAVRKAVADFINDRFGAHETPDDIYMTCGAAASLSISLNALLHPGEEVVFFAPFFPEYTVFAEKAGAVIRTVGTKRGVFEPDPEAFRQVLSEKTCAVIVNSPNNPSGAVFSETLLRELCAILREAQQKYHRPIYLLADEPYRELVYDGIRVPYLMDLYENTLVCYSFSKSLSLPGERIGYIAVCHDAENREKVFAAICGAGRALGYVCAPVLFQKMLLSCLGQVSDLSAYAANRALLYESLCRMGYDCVKPEGAFYLFIRAPGGDDAAFCEKAKKKDLLLVPSASFGLPGYLRISYCVARSVIERSLPVFESLAREEGLQKTNA